jgi:hypothetical protein
MHQILMEVETGNIWQDFLTVAFDPAHILAELFFTIVFDGVIIALLYGVVFKRFILPRLRRDIHRQIDAEHGVGHDDEHGSALHEHTRRPSPDHPTDQEPTP